MIALIDNRDSFVWNLADYVSLHDEVEVVPNTISPCDLHALAPDGIIISPGPGAPEKRRYVGNVPVIVSHAFVPVLGVCLGHQVIGHVFGGAVSRVAPMHGKASDIFHDARTIFEGIASPFRAGRYHSLAVTRCPPGFEVSATTEDGTIMGIRSLERRIEGVQFHPESVLTGERADEGRAIVRNFLDMCEVGRCL